MAEVRGNVGPLLDVECGRPNGAGRASSTEFASPLRRVRVA
ncbi:MAG: hypothetical protein Q8N93_10690 [Bacillota bacterium]|nr:hypothetical protein [Bacillota bacterium]